jgi:type VI secretion system protein ImpH
VAGAGRHAVVAVTEPTAVQRLTVDPASFAFDAALRLLMQRAGVADPAEAARFESAPGLAFAPSDVVAVDVVADPPSVTLGLLGLIGSAGVMPRRYTEQAASNDGDALHALADLLAHRMLAGLGSAGFKYRLERAVETARLAGDEQRAGHAEVLLAVAGFAEAGIAERLPFGGDALLHYAGLFVLRPRSAERLAALASDWLGRAVEVVEFVGAWLPIERDQRSRLGVGRDRGAFCVLGQDAAVGVRAWDPQARVMLRIGPLDRPGFEALLPDKAALVAFVGLVRAYLGFEVGFGVNLVLAADEVPAVRLDGRGMLGWNTWLGRGKGYVARGDADDARFAAEVVEG